MDDDLYHYDIRTTWVLVEHNPDFAPDDHQIQLFRGVTAGIERLAAWIGVHPDVIDDIPNGQIGQPDYHADVTGADGHEYTVTFHLRENRTIERLVAEDTETGWYCILKHMSREHG